MNEIKKIIFTIVCVILVCGACFFAGFRRGSKNSNAASERIQQLQLETSKLQLALKERTEQLERIEQQTTELENSIGSAVEIVEQSRVTIGQLGTTVDDIKLEGSNFGNTIKLLREGLRSITIYVNQLEEYNLELEGKLRELQTSPGE